jgi:hypothetical protein
MAASRNIERMCAIHVIEERQTSGILTEAEERFREETEPSLRLRGLESRPGMDSGRQSRVSLLAYDYDGREHHVVWKRMGAGKGLAEDEASDLWKRLHPYREKLTARGWNVPLLYYSDVVEAGDGESQIFSYEQFIEGGDAAQMLKDPAQPNFRKWFFVEEVLRTLYRYESDLLVRGEVAGRTVSLLPDGLDLKAANFVLEKDSNELYFVDLFGPKELTEDRRWANYSPKIDTLPAENLRAICATREGIILRFWRLAVWLWSDGDDRGRELTREFLDRLEAIEPPAEEFDLINEEIRSDCPWMDSLYKEHHV